MRPRKASEHALGAGHIVASDGDSLAQRSGEGFEYRLDGVVIVDAVRHLDVAIEPAAVGHRVEELTHKLGAGR